MGQGARGFDRDAGSVIFLACAKRHGSILVFGESLA